VQPSSIRLDTFDSVGKLLKFLRRRARLSQRELSIAVGYSESHLSRIESNQRQLDRTSLLALFIPALHIENEPEIIARILALCEQPLHPASRDTAEAVAPAAPVMPSTQAVLQHPLPTQLTSFIGREEEVAEVCRLLGSGRHRLLTLTGAGGCGKTRLALYVGEEMAQAYEHGVWLVELAPLADPQLLPPIVAATLGLSKVTGDAPLAQLAEFLYARRTLLILDNCEHLVEAAASLAAALLQACPQVQILATSRETLAIPGEMNYRVHPLALPPSQWNLSPTCAEVVQYDAIQLFVERARNSLHSFKLTNQNAPAVARICQRLDGIPLAIELAAAWVCLLAPEQIANRLEQDFELLVDGRRCVLARHQTVRAAMDWSYNLLSEAERVLLRRLSIFVGGWNLNAAEAVTADEVGEQQWIAHDTVLKLLNQLVNKSLVVVDYSVEGEPRYRLLELLREYAQEELAKANEAEKLHSRHLAYFIDLAETIDTKLDVHPQHTCLAGLEQEQENCRAALSWSLLHSQEEGLRLATALGRFWRHGGYYSEGRRWLQLALASTLQPSSLRARALLRAGIFARLQRDFTEAILLSEASLQLAGRWSEPMTAALALENMGWIYADTEEYECAVSFFQQSLGLFRQEGCQRRSGRLLATLAQMALRQANLELARSHLQEALILAHAANCSQSICLTLSGLSELACLAGDYAQTAQLLKEVLAYAAMSGNKQDLAWAYCGLAETCWHQGEYEAALHYGELGLQLFEDLGSMKGRAILLHHLGLVELALGHVEVASCHLHRSLQLCNSLKKFFMAARCLAALAGVALCRGEPMRAARLLGVATGCFALHPHQLTPADEAFYFCLRENASAQLEKTSFLAAWTAGSVLSIEEACSIELNVKLE
jgi:predicted ATPase/transcriptional regulator with XRE-family HTH domain